VGKVVCSHSEGVWRNGGIAALILTLGTRWRWVTISRPGHFTTGLRYRFSKRLARPYSWSGRFGEEKNFLSLQRDEPRFIGCLTHSHSLAVRPPPPPSENSLRGWNWDLGCFCFRQMAGRGFCEPKVWGTLRLLMRESRWRELNGRGLKHITHIRSVLWCRICSLAVLPSCDAILKSRDSFTFCDFARVPNESLLRRITSLIWILTKSNHRFQKLLKSFT